VIIGPHPRAFYVHVGEDPTLVLANTRMAGFKIPIIRAFLYMLNLKS